MAALTSVVRDGGIVVNTTVWMPAPSDEERGVRGVNLFVNSDTAQLARLVSLVDSGAVRVAIARRVPLAELPALHAEAAEGALSGKVLALPSAASLT